MSAQVRMNDVLAGRYQIVSPLGAGGMGEVFLARDLRLERRVAVKLLPRELESDVNARERLRREALAAAALDHPFICKVHEIGEDDGRTFIVMEYVDGETLQKTMRDGAVPMRRVLEMAHQLAQALEEAHARGIVHRDLKPSNVMITPQGHVKVMDFGLAKIAQAADQSGSGAGTMVLTGAGVRLGTPAYMSPEQVLGAPLDPRSDVFSLGVILHELTTGSHPFLRDEPSETMAAILRDPPAAGARDQDGVPGLRHVLQRMLAKACAERFQTASELRVDLEALRDRAWASGSSSGGSTVAAPAVAPERTPFVGRDNESADLKRMLDRMLTGQGSIALVGGEPGVGKTRLVRELLREARQRGCLCLTGHCYEMEGAPPFVPFIEVLEESVRTVPQAVRASMGDLASDIAVIVPSLRRAFPDIPPAPALPAEQQRRLVFASYLEYIQRASQKSPIVCLFDDLHWGDDSTLQLLLHLAPHVHTMRLLLVGTYRDVELDVKRPFAKALESLLRQRLATRIALRRLTESVVEQMITAMSGSTPPAGVARVVFKETEGNPFFVEEVYQHLAEEGQLFDEAGLWRPNLRVDALAVPESVRLVIGRRLDRLGDAARKILTAAAVIGRSFSLDLLQIVADASEDDVLNAVEDAERAQLVAAQPAGREARFGFIHELIRTTLVSGLSLPRRQRLHLKIADALERLRASSLDSHVSVLAHHLFQAGAAADAERTARVLLQAARRALDAAAFEDAVETIDNVISLEFDEGHALMPVAYETQGVALIGLGQMDRALPWFDRSQRLYAGRGDNEGVARTAAAAASCHLWQTNMPDAIGAINRGLSSLQPSALSEQVALRAMLAILQSTPSYVDDAARTMAKAMADLDQVADPVVHARVQGSNVLYLRLLGQINDAARNSELVLGSLGRLPIWERAEALWTLALTFYYQGRFQAMSALLPDLEAAATRAGHHGAQWASERAANGMKMLRDGDIAAYLRDTQVALDRWPAIHPFLLQTQIAICLTYLGRWADAAPWLVRAEAHPIANEHSNTGIIEATWFAGAAVAGDRDAAAARLPALRARLPRPGRGSLVGNWHALEAAIPNLMLIGARDECGSLYADSLRLIATGLVCNTLTLGPSNPELSAAVAAHAAGLTDNAREHFERAAAQARDIPFRLLQPAVNYWYGRLLTEHADGAEQARGRAMIEAAAADFRQLQMPLHAGLADAALRTSP